MTDTKTGAYQCQQHSSPGYRTAQRLCWICACPANSRKVATGGCFPVLRLNISASDVSGHRPCSIEQHFQVAVFRDASCNGYPDSAVLLVRQRTDIYFRLRSAYHTIPEDYTPFRNSR
jgi:hypothetical protein